jgi:hypothetical protein
MQAVQGGEVTVELEGKEPTVVLPGLTCYLSESSAKSRCPRSGCKVRFVCGDREAELDWWIEKGKIEDTSLLPVAGRFWDEKSKEYRVPRRRHPGLRGAVDSSSHHFPERCAAAHSHRSHAVVKK